MIVRPVLLPSIFSFQSPHYRYCTYYLTLAYIPSCIGISRKRYVYVHVAKRVPCGHADRHPTGHTPPPRVTLFRTRRQHRQMASEFRVVSECLVTQVLPCTIPFSSDRRWGVVIMDSTLGPHMSNEYVKKELKKIYHSYTQGLCNYSIAGGALVLRLNTVLPFPYDRIRRGAGRYRVLAVLSNILLGPAIQLRMSRDDLQVPGDVYKN